VVLQTIKRINATWIGHGLRKNCFLNVLFKEKWKGREDEEDVCGTRITLRNGEGAGI
jgi:hypothetical protein